MIQLTQFKVLAVGPHLISGATFNSDPEGWWLNALLDSSRRAMFDQRYGRLFNRVWDVVGIDSRNAVEYFLLATPGETTEWWPRRWCTVVSPSQEGLK